MRGIDFKRRSVFGSDEVGGQYYGRSSVGVFGTEGVEETLQGRDVHIERVTKNIGRIEDGGAIRQRKSGVGLLDGIVEIESLRGDLAKGDISQGC